MSAALQLAGQRFGKVVVLEMAPLRRRGKTFWRVKCDCGSTAVIGGSQLKNGYALSCGCLRGKAPRASRSGPAAPRYKHGHARHTDRTPEYVAWRAIRARCSNKNRPDYARYGAKGVSVCERWCQSYEAFLSDMGPRPSAHHSIDRVDNRGNYEPGNCRWATRSEQAKNTGRRRILVVDGVSKNLVDWAASTGLRSGTIGARLKRGWTSDAAVKTDVRGES